jgi:lysine 2,3-aminomutase
MNSSESELPSRSAEVQVEIEEPPGTKGVASPPTYLPVVGNAATRVSRTLSPSPPAEPPAPPHWSISGATRRLKSSPQTRAFRRDFYPEVSDSDWNDWRWQSRNRIKTLAQFERLLELSEDEREGLVRGGSMLPVGVTPYYMSLLHRHDAEQPLRRTVVPIRDEFLRTAGEADDPLGEDGHSPVPGLVHRYPDRVLLLALDFCSTYCRYCTRSRVVGHGEIMPSEARLEKAFEYIRNTPTIRDCLISGGIPSP